MKWDRVVFGHGLTAPSFPISNGKLTFYKMSGFIKIKWPARAQVTNMGLAFSCYGRNIAARSSDKPNTTVGRHARLTTGGSRNGTGECGSRRSQGVSWPDCAAEIGRKPTALRPRKRAPNALCLSVYGCVAWPKEPLRRCVILQRGSDLRSFFSFWFGASPGRACHSSSWSSWAH